MQFEQLLLLTPTPAVEPTWNDLIVIQPWDGFGNQSIASAIAFHTRVECDRFADLLLKNHLLVESTRRACPANDLFIQKVLDMWYKRSGSAIPCTWKDLIGCMKGAGLDSHIIEIIRQHTCKSSLGV